MSQLRQNPTLHDQYRRLDLRLVLRAPRPRGDHRHSVVLGHLQIRRVDVRLVPVRSLHRAAKLIGHQHLRHRTKELEAADRSPNEIRKSLRARRLRVRVIARPEHHHEKLNLDQLARVGVHELWFLARIVDESLLAPAVHPAHRRFEPHSPRPVQLAKLAVLVRLRPSSRTATLS